MKDRTPLFYKINVLFNLNEILFVVKFGYDNSYGKSVTVDIPPILVSTYFF